MGTLEIVLILILALLILGPKQLQNLARLFGRGYQQIQKQLSTLQKDLDSSDKTP